MIAITEFGATVATGCIKAYYTDAMLQSVCSNGRGNGIAQMIHLTQYVLGFWMFAYYIATVVDDLATSTKHLVCAMYILPTSF